MNREQQPDQPKPLSKRTDDEIRDRARALHHKAWVIEIPEDATVIKRAHDETAIVQAWVHLGEDD